MNAGPFAIIGNPVQNSLSPALFRAAYPHAPERTYGRLEAPAAETAWELVQSMGLQGGNVTMPFKAAFARFAAVKDEAVTAIGATNVILNRGKGWEAYNTDHYGVVESFREAGAGLKDERFWLLEQEEREKPPHGAWKRPEPPYSWPTGRTEGVSLH
jgi:shikimate 5-dehydrogenase